MIRTPTLAALTLVSALLVPACNKEAPPAAEQARAPVGGALAERPSSAPAIEAARTAAEPAGTPPALASAAVAEPTASRVAESNFELSIANAGAAEAGKPAHAEIVLDAKAPFHVNDKYPYKFKLKETPGLAFPNPVVGKDALVLEKTRAKMTVPFTAEKSGKYVLAGQFSFSVCTDDKCLIEKRDLSLPIEAKGP
jgi:hypothetical protein